MLDDKNIALFDEINKNLKDLDEDNTSEDKISRHTTLKPVQIKYKIYINDRYKSCTYSNTHNEYGELKLSQDTINKVVRTKYKDLPGYVAHLLNKDLGFYRQLPDPKRTIKVYIDQKHYKDFII